MKSTEITARPRKRSRTSEDAEDTTVAATGKKARGRPRVDTQDATAADVSTALCSHLFAPLLRPFFPIPESYQMSAINYLPETDAVTSDEGRRFGLPNAHTGSAKKQQ